MTVKSARGESMGEEIMVVGPTEKRKWFYDFCYTIYLFFAWIGEGILRCPNRAFYAVLVILCILAPIFAIILVIGLLCGIYRRGKPCLQ